MSDSVLILGAGIYQLPLINRVKARGLRSIVASIPGDYPGIQVADEFHAINTTDIDGIIQLAADKSVKAVVTAGTDVALPAVAEACDALDLCGPTVDMVGKASNKLQMKIALSEGGARTAAFRKATTIDSAREAFEAIDGPVVFKCVDKSGSRGITVVRSEDGIEEAFARALSESDCDYLVVEQFVFGHEIGVDGYVDDQGSAVFVQPHDKVVWNNGSTNVPIGHKINAVFDLWCRDCTDLFAVVRAAISSVGARSCFFNMDVMIDCEGNCWVIEVGLRSGATCIPEVISLYYGHDYYDAILDSSLGLAPTFGSEPIVGATEGRLLFADKVSRYVPSKLTLRKGLDIAIDSNDESNWPAFITGNQRRGQIVGYGNDPLLLSLQIEEAVKLFNEHCLTCIS